VNPAIEVWTPVKLGPVRWNLGHPSKRQRLAFFREGWELLFDVVLISCCGHRPPEFPKILIAPKF
jgi:hypothetical protein